MGSENRIQETINYIDGLTDFRPDVGIVLGSGLGDLGDRIKNAITIDYNSIPNFPRATVKGHRGCLVLGQLGSKNVIAMQGRFHYYEGHSLQDIAFPIRIMIGLGISALIVTNASGGVDTRFRPGDLMVIKDHINITGLNPLVGRNCDNLGPRFVDMTTAYDAKLINIAKTAGKSLGIDLKEGVYMWFVGPTYETPAEIRLARLLGASAVGMSTIPEVIIAAHQNVRVLGISCITNMAAGILEQPLCHEDVIKTSLLVKDKFEDLIIEILLRI